MENYLPIMTEDYQRKHYGTGIFGRAHKNTAKVSVLAYIFFGAVLVGGGFGACWFAGKGGEARAMGEADVGVFCYVLAALCGIFALISLVCIILSFKRHTRSDDQWTARIAKESGCSEKDVDDFERQALEMESRVICLLDPAKKALSAQEDGVLTRDFVYLTVGSDYLAKISDLAAAVLFMQTIRVGSGRAKQGVDYLCVGLITKGGKVSTVAECSKESGMALIGYLQERCPGLYTADGEVLSSREYDDLWAKVREQAD